jgi:DNA-binding PadR family transcriptional regulator
MRRRPTLSLNEWAVLGVLVDRPRHGYDIAAELRAGTPLGDIWTVSRQLVYRAIERLEALDLARPRRREPGAGGPPRTVYSPTDQGRATLDTWLTTPVRHLRDVRSALLLKLALTDRLGLDRATLVEAQQRALADRLAELADPPDDHGDIAALWRHHSATAVAQFLGSVSEPDDAPPPPASPGSTGPPGPT